VSHAQKAHEQIVWSSQNITASMLFSCKAGPYLERQAVTELFNPVQKIPALNDRCLLGNRLLRVHLQDGSGNPVVAAFCCWPRVCQLMQLLQCQLVQWHLAHGDCKGLQQYNPHD
jgi:hypothetical protein